MFENFNTVDFVILGFLCLMNIVCIAFIIFLVLKNKKTNQVLERPAEVKVTKVNDESEETGALDEIIEAMQKDIDAEKEDAVELFEQEQEEKAIISYQELLNAKNKTDKKEEVVNKEEVKKATPKLVTTKENKFTNSEFVSPVFGKMDKKNNTNLEIENEETFDPHELEKTLNIEPLSEEIKKNNEFLNALKEFRKNL